VTIKIPSEVEEIFSVLKNNGFEYYIVGGCVRDSILNKQPHDYDICTNAKPDEMLKIFSRYKVIPTGLQHGTITVVVNGNQFEVTTYRIDGNYSDNRRPDSVQFTNSLTEDLSRRDFCVNAMAYNKKQGIVDPFNGLYDINHGIIRCVGNANERFQEDALRMMRAVRFSAQLGFSIEHFTKQAIKGNSGLIQNISKERIHDEICKILLSNNPDYIEKLYYYDIMDYVIPELVECFQCRQNNPYHVYDVGEHEVISTKYVEPILHLRLAALLHDVSKPLCKSTDEKYIDHFYNHALMSSEMAGKILKRLRFDNYTIMRVKDLIQYHDQEIGTTKKSVRRLLNKIGEENFRELLKIKEADIKTQNRVYYQERHDKLLKVQQILDEVINLKECCTKNQLVINGNDLISIGFKQGKQIGEMINYLLEIVLDNPDLNNRDDLLKIVNEKYR
jgi:tRNA nucleotidyltransferase (CCA-adding enzyme)